MNHKGIAGEARVSFFESGVTSVHWQWRWLHEAGHGEAQPEESMDVLVVTKTIPKHSGGASIQASSRALRPDACIFYL